MGRPTIFTQELADEICERLVDGDSLRRICRRAAMPGVSTVCRWLAANEPFREQYARARELQADTLADEILYIADTPKIGSVVSLKEVSAEIEGEAEEGEAAGGAAVIAKTETRTKKGDMLGHRRLQIDARKWLAAKLAPKKYGDHLELGGQVGVAVVLGEPMTETEWAAKHAPG